MLFTKHSDSKNSRWPSPKPCVRHFLCLHLHCSQDNSVSSQFAVVEHSQCSKEFISPRHKGGEGERKGEEVGGGEKERGKEREEKVEEQQHQNTSIATHILRALTILVLITRVC